MKESSGKYFPWLGRVLRAAMKTRSDRDLSCRLDEVFADPEVAAEQLRVAEQMDSAGTDWSAERW